MAEYPFLTHVLRAFKRWEEEEFPRADVRIVLCDADM